MNQSDLEHNLNVNIIKPNINNVPQEKNETESKHGNNKKTIEFINIK